MWHDEKETGSRVNAQELLTDADRAVIEAAAESD